MFQVSLEILQDSNAKRRSDELTRGSVSHGWLEILEMGATDFEFFWESSRDSNIECESMYQNTRNSSWDDFTGFDLRNSMIER